MSMLINHQLAAILDDLLNVGDFRDYAPNGLQVEGRREIRKIVGAVSASLDVIQKAQSLQADALLVHHGYFWKGEDPCLIGMKKKRLQALLRDDINLYAYHLPLDCSVSFGNNSRLADVLNFDVTDTITIGGNANLLWFGTWSESTDAKALKEHLAIKLERQPQHISPPSNKSINKIAWCTGAAQDYIEKAVELGADAFISGEVSERTYYQAQENDVHYFACGHHATERFGIQALCSYLAREYQLDYQFIDSQNPV